MLSSALFPLGCKDSNPAPLAYPQTQTVDQVDHYFGHSVKDPYRWLEAGSRQEVGTWIKMQNKFTFGYLEKIPYRSQIKERLKSLFDYTRISAPLMAGEYFIFQKNDGLQNQAVYYYQHEKDAKPKVFLDPNTLSSDGTVSVELLSVSSDKRYVAYALSYAGSDWSEIGVKEVETSADLNDRLKWVKFSGVSWYKDGFFYGRFPKPLQTDEHFKAPHHETLKKNEIYYHKLGTDQSEDKLIYKADDDPNLLLNIGITSDKAYLILTRSSGTDGFETYVKSTTSQQGGFRPLFRGFEHKNYVVDHHEGRLWVITDIDAPNYRLVSIDPLKPSKEHWIEIIAEQKFPLRNVRIVGGKLFAAYLENAYTHIYQYDISGNYEKQVPLPGQGTALISKTHKEDSCFFLTYNSFVYPNTILKYDVEKELSEVYYQPSVVFNPEDYQSKQIHYKSKDGTLVSMFIVHKVGLEADGQRPCLLYAYGGFNVAMTPAFNPSNIVLLENGGIVAVPNLRGGGEYGEMWHRAGMREKKQNVFDDFIAAAEYLIREGYTSPGRLAIAGGSNGGLLVGACMTQRPDLFSVALPAVGVMDMLRYQKFTIGWAWIPEYGSSDSSEEDFQILMAYSPLHNLVEGVHYPATLITTADHDDRVVPAHSFKFAATLQKVQGGNRPVLIRIQTDAGHGAGKPVSKTIEEQADKWAFMFYNLESDLLYE